MDEIQLVLDRFAREGTARAVVPPSGKIRRRGARRRRRRFAGATLAVLALVAAVPLGRGLAGMGAPVIGGGLGHPRIVATATPLPAGLDIKPGHRAVLVSNGINAGGPWAFYAYRGPDDSICTALSSGFAGCADASLYDPARTGKPVYSVNDYGVYDSPFELWRTATFYNGTVPLDAAKVRVLANGVPTMEVPVRRIDELGYGFFGFWVAGNAHVDKLEALDASGAVIHQHHR
jgi:hypothetical protein